MADALPVIYLARHGKTAWSLSGQHTGRTDLPLTGSGERDARALGSRLRGLAFAKTFTSPLQRAVKTCELAGFIGTAELDPDLMEWDYGRYEGRRTAEILAERPDWQLFRDGCPGGEAPAGIGARADRVVSRVRAVHGDVLVFSSAHILRVFAACWLGLELAGGRYLLLGTESHSVLGAQLRRAGGPAVERHASPGKVMSDGQINDQPAAGEPAPVRVIPMTTPDQTVFLVDVDNTLLDNDRIQADLRRHLEREFGAACRDRYWTILEQLFGELGYRDYLGALQRYRVEHPKDIHLLSMSSYLVDYPFANRLYPGALDVLERFRGWARTVILSDGDVVFQPRKVERSGIFEAVDGHVLIYIHKEEELDDVEQRYPAGHYVLVDDKPRILAAVKKVWGHRVSTVLPRQGQFAHAPDAASYPAPDMTVERISDLLAYDFANFFAAPGIS